MAAEVEMERGTRMARRTTRLGQRLVMFPLPFQGHINPMFQLATLLFRRGFSITVVHTRFNAPDPSSYPDFRFAPIDDGLGELPSSSDIMAKAIALNARCSDPFRDRMARLLQEAEAEGEEPVACLVADVMLYSIEAVAEELGVRRVVVRTGSAACLRLFRLLPTLWEKGYYPIQEDRREEEVPEAPPYRVKDLVRMSNISRDESMYELVTHSMSGIRTAAALVLNTFEDLEQTDLATLRGDLPQPVFPVGPLHKFSLNASNSLLEQDRSCMEWLDRQPPASVIYVSFGSLACMNGEELGEVAWGLAGSGQRFLWVVRPGSVRGMATVELPAEFAEETRGRGRVVAWAPQLEVLAHPAVGGFWSHCGWNSIVESLCEGVPMLCRPSFGDQPGNARYVSHVWKVGLALEGVLERGEVERAVRRLMVDEKGVEMRERAREIKFKAGSCIREAGSSYKSLDNLVDFILSY